MDRCEICAGHGEDTPATTTDVLGTLPLCQSCADHLNEATYQRSLDDYYGGSGACTDAEFYQEAAALKRSQR